MKKGEIQISPKHGLNPSLLICPVCGKDIGVAICGRLPNDTEAPRRVIDIQPCNECLLSVNEWSAKGCLFVVVSDEYDFDKKDTESFWPYFHSFHVLKQEAIDRWNETEDGKSCPMKDKNIVSLAMAKLIGLVTEEGEIREQ